MTTEGMKRALSLLQGKQQISGLSWNEPVAALYRQVLAPHKDSDVLPLLETLVFETTGAIDVSDLKRQLSGRATDSRPSDYGAPSERGYERQKAGVSCYQLMREGFDEEAERRCMAQKDRDEWDRLFRKIEHDRKARGLGQPEPERAPVAAGGKAATGQTEARGEGPLPAFWAGLEDEAI